MTDDLAAQRCLNHGGREAVAKCPGCSNFFCRECVVEHENRMMCANCVARLEDEATGPGERGNSLVRAFQFAAAFVLLSVVVYVLGLVLLMLPDTFHEGEIWRGNL